MKRRSNNPKAGRRHGRSGRPREPAQFQPTSALPPVRKWLFRLIALSLPLLALGALEATLRLSGYGYPTQFFKKIRVGNQEFLVDNDHFGLRFFPPELVRVPVSVRMKASKPANTFRIFILGESAAMGDPEPAFGAGRYLQTLMLERFPGKDFEVINVAMTAINSHAILPIARECARYQGDLWIIYMGNNEMVGPFGAATVFGARSPPLGLIRLTLTVQKTRVGQLLVALGRKIKGKSSNASWAGMQMFLQSQIPTNDRHKEVVYQHFQKNLHEILRAGLDSGAKIILSVVAVNLKDCPPFASLGNSNLPATDRAQFAKLYREGSQAEGQGDFAAAAQRYEQASRLAPRFAELQFRWGECLLRLTNAAAARQRFQLACDYDTLPFRTDSRINSLITQAGRQWARRGVHLFDAVAALETNSPSSICGQESFYEHVHFNFDGNYRLARAWAAKIEPLLPTPVRKEASPGWASQAACERRLGLTEWNRRNVLEEVTRRMQQPPLSSQFNNHQQTEALQIQIRELRGRMDASAARQARTVYREALERAPEDYFLRQNFADFLLAMDDFEQATAEWQRVSELIPQRALIPQPVVVPHDPLSYFRVGRLHALEGKLVEAQSFLSRAVTLRPAFSEAWFQLGKIHAVEGKLELALEEYDRTRRLQPQDHRVHHDIGKVLWKLNRRAEAIQRFREAVRLKPDYWEAHYTLGGALGYDDQISEARHAFEEVIRLNPDYALAHLNLGVALMKLGELKEAHQQFEETLRLEPENKFALDYRGQIQAMIGAKP